MRASRRSVATRNIPYLKTRCLVASRRIRSSESTNCFLPVTRSCRRFAVVETRDRVVLLAFFTMGDSRFAGRVFLVDPPPLSDRRQREQECVGLTRGARITRKIAGAA